MNNRLHKMIPAAAAVLVAAVTVLSGCATNNGENKSSATPAPAVATQAMNWQAMDKEMEAGMKAFPAPTQGKGGQELKPDIENGVKVFHLTVSKIKWQVAPNKTVDAFAYNGTVPGPTIHVAEGDKVRVVVKNELDESTTVHWHGLLVDNKQDGVPFMTQDEITPGSTYTYEWTATNPGTQFYHSHNDTTKQVTMGLYGPLIIDPKDPAVKSKYGATQDVVEALSDGAMGYTINGKEFPATEPVVAKLGEKVRIRYINAGQMVHTMHLHGLTQLVVAKDGYDLPQPYKADTILIGPGERYDVIVDANSPGTWAWHCHVLSHAESEQGMFGMVTAFIVK